MTYDNAPRNLPGRRHADLAEELYARSPLDGAKCTSCVLRYGRPTEPRTPSTKKKTTHTYKFLAATEETEKVSSP
ncbi:hypothetical protein EVAR_7832_1 [Eumeta japonica]|uniref:Uncharacterized protein n=1 Tax=Eumeta variegata TaxID=151549 RepID=A0A4C1TV02_EUMVA|nr:hypothetical protein EVAR_7832_1 [Eumeta japonica]